MNCTPKPRFSVVIPTYNRHDLLRRAIESVLRQDLDSSDFEIIVVNDGSTDQTREYLRSLSERKNVQVIELENSGPSIARNCGVRAARGPIVAFVDDDCVVRPDWLINLERELIARKAAAVGGVVRSRSAENLWSSVYDEMNLFHYRKWNQDDGRARFLTTNNFTCWKEVFDKMNGFDERFLIGAEDREFVARLIAAGEKVCFAPEIEVDHFHTFSVKSFLTHLYRQGQGSYLLYRVIANEKSLGLTPPSASAVFRLVSEMGRGQDFLEGAKRKMIAVVAQLAVFLGYLTAGWKGVTDLR